MACSVSFPRNRAAVVGYLKAVLATAGGLWALLWVQVFKDRYGLLPFMAISAIASFTVGVLSLSSMKVLPNQCRERVQSQGDLVLIFLNPYLGVSKNRGTTKSSISIGFSI